MASYTGIPPNNPSKYLGPNVSLVSIVSRNREPTGADIRQGSTGNYYPIGSLWVISKDPTTGTEGEIFALSKIVANVAFWSKIGDFSGGFPITPYVVGPSGQAGYQTIQSAIDAANAEGGGAIWIQQGTYTEDLTLYDQIYLCAVPLISQGQNEGVAIIGKHTPPISGHTQINGCYLQSNTHIFDSSEAGTSHIQTANCETACLNGYVFNLPNWTGIIEVYDCNPGPESAPFVINDGGINNIAGAQIIVYNSGVGNGSNVMNISGPSIFGQAVSVGCPLTLQSSASLDSIGSQYLGSLTIQNSSSITSFNDSFLTGANDSIIYSSSANSSISNATISSSANPCISGSGAGTLSLGIINFIDNDQIAGTLTTSVQSIRPLATAGDTGTAIRGVSGFDASQFSVDSTGFVSITNFSPISYIQIDNSDSPYSVTNTDHYISCDSSLGAITIELPNNTIDFRTFVIKDRVGSASENNITLTTPGGIVTLDGFTSFPISANFASLNLIFNGSNYEIY